MNKIYVTTQINLKFVKKLTHFLNLIFQSFKISHSCMLYIIIWWLYLLITSDF